MDPQARAERRRKAIALATATRLTLDELASAFMAGAAPLEAVLCDVEREALERIRGARQGDPSAPRGYRVGLAQLQSTLRGVRSAHAVGDSIALRGELANLAAKATVWASDLPVPVERRTRPKAAA
jgi:hypothetical protein